MNEQLENDKWFYYHKESKIKKGPFSLYTLCLNIIEENFNPEDIYLCLPGWKKWEKATAIDKFKLNYEKARENNPEEELAIPEISEDSKEQFPLNGIDKRKHHRVPLALKAIFIFKNKTFRTKTEDLSLGGLKLTHPLPEEFFGNKIEVFLSSPDQKISIKFEAELIKNVNSLTHIKFLNKNELGLKNLETWIMAMTQTKKIA